MKLNDKIPVTIAGQVVANANVKEVGDGTVTLVVPATLVVMATRTEISTPEPVEQSSETIITGVERTNNDEVAEQPQTAVSDVQVTNPDPESGIMATESTVSVDESSAPAGETEPVAGDSE